MLGSKARAVKFAGVYLMKSTEKLERKHSGSGHIICIVEATKKPVQKIGLDWQEENGSIYLIEPIVRLSHPSRVFLYPL